MVKNIKKIFMFVFVFVLFFCSLLSLSACGKINNNDKISIVCTIFPEYDWVTEILGDKNDNFDLTLLMNNKTDMHNYLPTVADIAKIITADIFIYVGGESDKWVNDALKNATNKDMIVINLLDVLGDKAKEKEHKEGMQGEYHNHEHEEEFKYDEHVWLSLKNTKIFINEIATQISNFDAKNKEIYLQNSCSYIEKLNELDIKYQEIVDNGTKTTLLFGDRFPFRYLVEDYGLNYYAPFSGCSAETEASFETIAFLSNKVDELGINVIIIIETSNDSIAKTIIQNTKNKNQTILTLDSMQNKTLKSEKTYLSIMESNLDTLREAVK